MTENTQVEPNDDFYSEDNEAKSNWFKFENVGDKIKGRFQSAVEQPGDDVFGPQMVYEIETDDGELWNVPISLSKTVVVKSMRRVRVGQMVGFFYASDYINDQMKAKKMNAAKTIKCFIDKTHDPVAEEMRKAEETELTPDIINQMPDEDTNTTTVDPQTL